MSVKTGFCIFKISLLTSLPLILASLHSLRHQCVVQPVGEPSCWARFDLRIAAGVDLAHKILERVFAAIKLLLSSETVQISTA